jgi:excinuclease ABC subunit B
VKRAINEASYLYSSSKAGAGAEFESKASGRKAEDAREIIEEMKRELLEAADNLEFEKAAYLRDKIKEMESARRAPAKVSRKGKR